MDHYFTNNNHKSNLQLKNILFKDKSFKFYTDNGVFSKRGLDFGSRTLLEQIILEDISGDVLDLGCGYGVIGIILSSFFNINVDMVDVNKRAIHLSQMNIKENGAENVNAYVSDIYESINKKYNFIITNPPIRAGKDVVYNFLFKAKDYLTKEGVLYFVVNKDQGARSIIKDLSLVGTVDVLKKNKGFFVIKCIFN